jgi:hypothetical protein
MDLHAIVQCFNHLEEMIRVAFFGVIAQANMIRFTFHAFPEAQGATAIADEQYGAAT